jgi:hypothetical protein
MTEDLATAATGWQPASNSPSSVPIVRPLSDVQADSVRFHCDLVAGNAKGPKTLLATRKQVHCREVLAVDKGTPLAREGRKATGLPESAGPPKWHHRSPFVRP